MTGRNCPLQVLNPAASTDVESLTTLPPPLPPHSPPTPDLWPYAQKLLHKQRLARTEIHNIRRHWYDSGRDLPTLRELEERDARYESELDEIALVLGVTRQELVQSPRVRIEGSAVKHWMAAVWLGVLALGGMGFIWYPTG
ncbi:hypothetical protein K432DRAFT_382867 [Lepidopterella palustris CBS 459.81]|uniref:Uncharacterized protein n=1 Tax=Lepidopterella palustris CBS 459.81 TaxID=1314670 RepID=A0A8E2E9W8_9PEZI|nr:hypothetical protein K432DRAFT_382867 [Lepidopterella palustris CBS 459.81]